MKRLLVVITALLCLAVPATAAAYNPLTTACGTPGASSSSACSKTNNDPIYGPHGALKRVSLIIAIIAGVAAVIIILISGLEFITSGGDPQKAASARTGIIGAAVGLIIIVAAESILTFVLSKL